MGRCGVGDYARNLTDALSRVCPSWKFLTVHSPPSGTSVESNTDGNICTENLSLEWTLTGVFQAYRCLRNFNPDVVHFQFPGLGFRSSVLPFVFALILRILGMRVVATFHEPIIRHLSFAKYLFPLLAAHAILYVDRKLLVEGVRSARLAIALRKPRKVPIASNIPRFSGNSNCSDFIVRHGIPSKYYCFFGLIKPGKGLEALIELSAHIEEPIYVIGAFAPHLNSYHCQLHKAAMFARAGRGLGVIFLGALEERSVAELLYFSAANLFLLDGGLSERNTSVMASQIQGGATIVTGDTEAFDHVTNTWFVKNVSPENIKRILADIVAKPQTRLEATRDWEFVAKAHADIYRDVVRN